MKIHRIRTRPPRVEMLPLIDVVFLLLVVFIYAMLSMAVHKGMPVELPRAAQIQAQQPEQPLSVTVERDGSVFVNKAPVSLETLPELLKRQPGVTPETAVLLFADRQLPYQQLFDVLDRIRQSGLHRISLQARERQAR
jgi:biopolymer transport protein ExbD